MNSAKSDSQASHYLAEMAKKAGLHAHVSQDGASSVWSYKTLPIAIVSISKIAMSDKEKELVSHNTELISRAILEPENRAELLSQTVFRKKRSDIKTNLIAGTPKEVSAKILGNIEKAESVCHESSHDKPVTKPKRVVIKSRADMEKRAYPKLIKEYLFAA